MTRVLPTSCGWAFGLALLGGCAAEAPQGGKEVEGAEGISQALDVDGECLIGDETLEHACLHALYGPFETVTAQEYPGFVFTDVNAPHTAFTVELPASGSGFAGAVLYQPSTPGEYGILFDQTLDVAVYDEVGALVTPVGTAPGDEAICPELDYVTVYALSGGGATYTIALGSATDSSPVLIAEYLGAEASCEEACEPFTLVASRTYDPPAWEDAELTLDHHVVFELPQKLVVTEGKAGFGLTTLTVSADGEDVVCRYRGNGHKRYVFESCDNGAQAGDDIEAEYLKLHVKKGKPNQKTTVELTIQPECDHDHEEE
jgi:hypothetical protein